MEQTVDQTLAMNELLASLRRVKSNPQPLCLIKPTIDFVLGGKGGVGFRLPDGQAGGAERQVGDGKARWAAPLARDVRPRKRRY